MHFINVVNAAEGSGITINVEAIQFYYVDSLGDTGIRLANDVIIRAKGDIRGELRKLLPSIGGSITTLEAKGV